MFENNNKHKEFEDNRIFRNQIVFYSALKSMKSTLNAMKAQPNQVFLHYL